MEVSRGALPPTPAALVGDGEVPYFLWWTDVTIGRFRELLRDDDQETRAYWMGALLREANSRDVWLFVSPSEIRALWPRLLRHLGRARPMWAYVLGMNGDWPPAIPPGGAPRTKQPAQASGADAAR